MKKIEIPKMPSKRTIRTWARECHQKYGPNLTIPELWSYFLTKLEKQGVDVSSMLALHISSSLNEKIGIKIAGRKCHGDEIVKRLK